MRYLFIIMLSMVLGGCSSIADFTRDNKGRVTQIEIKGAIKGSVKTEAEEITFDSKKEPILSNLVNINGVKSK